MADATPDSIDAVAAAISEELVQIHEESYGVGVHQVRTHVLDDAVLVILDVELTTAEKTLMSGGSASAVRVQREAFQAVIAPTFKAVVERATGRKVEAFASHMSTDPVYSVELFRLAPASRYQTA